MGIETLVVVGIVFCLGCLVLLMGMRHSVGKSRGRSADTPPLIFSDTSQVDSSGHYHSAHCDAGSSSIDCGGGHH